jgi:hypothetical protein
LRAGCHSLRGQLIDRWAAGPQPIDDVVRFIDPKDFKDYCVDSELEADSNGTSSYERRALDLALVCA